MEESKFTYSYIKHVLHSFSKNNYVFSDYYNHGSLEKTCVIRHDVDYSPEKACEFAIFENNLEVKSTYFFLLSSDFYNIFSTKNQTIVERVLSLGHEIGLHFDETKYQISGNIELFKEYMEEEVFLMGKMIGKPIKVVSMHRPSKFVLDNNMEFKGIVNSYSDKFFKKFKYVSDSRMNWREDILSVIESNKYKKIHLLTHPFWYSHKDEDTKEKLYSFVKNASISRIQSLSENFRNLSEFVKEDDFA